jgi:chorismate-pyruvate lyase
MNLLLRSHGPSIDELCGLFPGTDDVAGYEPVAPEQVPSPYRELLVHEHHMTVTVEGHHGGPVDVRVLDERLDGESYARKILLVLHGTDRVVQYGLVRINLAYCSPEVRAAILAKGTPLGRILIEHNVLRRIEPTAILRIYPGSAMLEWFGLEQMHVTYGRLAFIHCDGKPAIELLEVVAPETERPPSA